MIHRFLQWLRGRQAPEPYDSESAAVQAWIDGEPILCRKCGRVIERHHGAWLHINRLANFHEAEPLTWE